jgi:hypothetical protein
MKNKILLSVLLFAFLLPSCNKSGGSSGIVGQTLNSPEALKEYLDKQPANSPDKPIRVSISANELMIPKIKDVLNSTGKYVSLNITGDALKRIPDYAFINIEGNFEIRKVCETLVSITIPNSVIRIGRSAFYGCNNLTSITIPESVTSIGEGAFAECYNLTSVTFQGTIASDDLDEVFHGDLLEKYLTGGIGTYTTKTPVPKSVWYYGYDQWEPWVPVWTKQ